MNNGEFLEDMVVLGENTTYLRDCPNNESFSLAVGFEHLVEAVGVQNHQIIQEVKQMDPQGDRNGQNGGCTGELKGEFNLMLRLWVE